MSRLLFVEWENGLVNCLYRFGSNRQRIFLLQRLSWGLEAGAYSRGSISYLI